jgi:CcmD family protein
MNDLGYIGLAFAVIWVGIFIYVFGLMQKEKTLRRDIENLRVELKSKG